MATGVTVGAAVEGEFTDMKLGRNGLKSIVYHIVDGEIVTESTSSTGVFADLANMMPSNDCRYCVYDTKFVTKDGRPQSKLVFLLW